jgi:hypothetical protein
MLAKPDFRTPTEEKTSGEVRERLVAAINSLSDADLIRLRKYAQWRMRALGHQAAGRECDDLLQEAITSTLIENRRWTPEKVDFYHHLVGAMRSIASAWSMRATTEARIPVAEAEEDEDGSPRTFIPFHNIPAREPNPEKQLEAKQTIRAVMDCFRDDHTAQQILTGFMDGLKGREIMAVLGMRPIEYDTARRRIHRRLRKLFDPRTEWENRKRTASEVP